MFRSLATVSARRTCAVPARAFSVSSARTIDTNPGSKTKKHATDKAKDGDTANVQEANAKAGMEYVQTHQPYKIVQTLLALHLFLSPCNAMQ